MKKEKTTMEKNPVIQTAKWAISMMKNKIVITLLMLATGIVFLVSPSGNMNGTVILIAIFIIIAAAINIGLHLVQKERTKLDVFFAVLNALLVLFGIFCLISPSTVEPVVRVIFAILTILSNLVNLIEIFQLENKKSWRFFVSLFVAIIMIGLGIAMIVAGEAVIQSIQQGIGVFLILNALINLWYIIRLAMEVRKAKKASR